MRRRRTPPVAVRSISTTEGTEDAEVSQRKFPQRENTDGDLCVASAVSVDSVVMSLAVGGELLSLPIRNVAFCHRKILRNKSAETLFASLPFTLHFLLSMNEYLQHLPDPAKNNENHPPPVVPHEGTYLNLPGGVTLDLLPVAAGSFMMGDSTGNGDGDEKPVHKVSISKPFWLGKTAVTQAQWKAVMGTSLQEQFDMAWNSSDKCWPGKDNKVSSLITMKEIVKIFGLENYEDVKRCCLGNVGENFPMNWVSHDEAVAFCKKLTEQERAAGRLPSGYEYGLPTEAQWEYACRAGTTGDYAGNLEAMAWYKKNSGGGTHAVAQKQPNAWGFHDMHGNVLEWCADWDDYYPSRAVTDPSGPRSGVRRVDRGGSWDGTAAGCRSADRGGGVPAHRDYGLGFRLALRPVLGDD
ncbi:MAG: formylglycine-generating enzyme family protein [Puniceicoccales bacterium]|jgi:formylglycine-generating enzyme required for sulfatase activity|nr:formylglycine-generating enzyme family protein [Puniceicoccales bacterium]